MNNSCLRCGNELTKLPVEEGHERTPIHTYVCDKCGFMENYMLVGLEHVKQFLEGLKDDDKG